MNRRYSRRGMLPLLAAGMLAAGVAPRPAAAAGATGVPPGRIAALARGFNLPDLVPATAVRPTLPDLLARLRRDGFTHVRLPVRAESVAPAFSGAATRSAALDDLDAALDLLLAHGYVVSVDLHPGGALGPLYRGDPAAALGAVIEAWSTLAPRLALRPAARVFAELLNEPPTDDVTWRDQAASLAASVRKVLPDTTLLVGAAPFERVDALAAWRPLADRNVVYVCHFYDPMPFTHQGATWETQGPDRFYAGVPFPAKLSDEAVRRALASLGEAGHREAEDALATSLARPWTVQAVDEAFAALGRWCGLHGVPAVLNEFGVLRSVAPRSDRLLWLATVRRAAEANGLGWAHWDFDEGFGLVVDGRPDAGVVDALMGHAPPRRP